MSAISSKSDSVVFTAIFHAGSWGDDIGGTDGILREDLGIKVQSLELVQDLHYIHACTHLYITFMHSCIGNHRHKHVPTYLYI